MADCRDDRRSVRHGTRQPQLNDESVKTPLSTRCAQQPLSDQAQQALSDQTVHPRAPGAIRGHRLPIGSNTYPLGGFVQPRPDTEPTGRKPCRKCDKYPQPRSVQTTRREWIWTAQERPLARLATGGTEDNAVNVARADDSQFTAEPSAQGSDHIRRPKAKDAPADTLSPKSFPVGEQEALGPPHSVRTLL